MTSVVECLFSVATTLRRRWFECRSSVSFVSPKSDTKDTATLNRPGVWITTPEERQCLLVGATLGDPR